MSGKYALIIGNTEYTDPGLAKLTAPGKDAEDFARVLKDPDICAFDNVKVLLNQAYPVIREAIDEFFDEKKPNDLLVLYFSGHGVRDEFGTLYLTAKNTNRARLRSTAIKSDFIHETMDQSRSKRQVLILDCCNSGAFPQGTKAEVGGVMGITQAFQGYGRFVLTASDSTQFAWEGNKVIGDTENSLFTHFLVEGLEGQADRDGDGKITVDELYDYTYEQVKLATPKQTPSKFSNKQQGEIILRQNMRIEDIKPIPLPDELIDETEDIRPYVREAAVQKLEKIIKGKNIGMVRSAVAALQKIAEDENTTRHVSEVATQVLTSYEQDLQEEMKARQAKLEAERIADEKAKAEREAREEAERLAKQKAEEERVAKAKREAERVADEKARAEREAREEAERLAKQKAEEERVAKAKLEAEDRAREKAVAEREAKEENKDLPQVLERYTTFQPRTIISVGLAVFICAGFYLFAIYFPGQRSKVNSTKTAVAEKTDVAIANSTKTAVAGKTGVAIVNSTKTAAAKKTSTAHANSTTNAVANQTSTAKAKATRTAAAKQTSTAIVRATNTAKAFGYGPISGSLEHEDDGNLETKRADVDFRDFVASATFINPYSPSTGLWDYGFLFRHETTNTQYRLSVNSSRQWTLSNNEGSPSGSVIQRGELNSLNVNEGSSNSIWIFCQGNIGILYVNGDFVSELDLSDRVNSGTVSIAIGFYSGYEIEGYSTSYEDFKVRALQQGFGPDSGSLNHENDDKVEVKSSGIDSRDFIVTATFLNPYSPSTGSWDYGFLFRDELGNSQFRLIFTSGEQWKLQNHIDSTGGTVLQSGQLSNLNVSQGASNNIWLFCQGSTGILFVNGDFVSTLDLSERMNSGAVRVGTGFYNSNEIEGYSTDYSNFSVWEFP